MMSYLLKLKFNCQFLEISKYFGVHGITIRALQCSLLFALSYPLCFLPECCTSEMHQYLSFKVLVPNVGAFNDRVYRVRSDWQRL